MPFMRMSAGRPITVWTFGPTCQAVNTSKAFRITTKPQASSACAASLAIGLAAMGPGPAALGPGPVVMGLGPAAMALGQVDTEPGRVVMAPGQVGTALGLAVMGPGPDPTAIRTSLNNLPTGRTNLVPGLAAFHGQEIG